MKEKFIKLKIKDYETKYLVSNYGRIFDTVYKKFISSHYISYVMRNGVKYKLNKPRPTVYININGVTKHYYVGRVVLMAFNPIDNYENMEVDHKDGNPDNNLLSNLEWVTHDENMRRAKINDLIPFGESHHNSKYSDELIHKICIEICNNTPRNEIKELYNVNGQLIDDIRSGRSHVRISNQYIDKGFTYKKENKEYKKARELLATKICELIEHGYSNNEIKEKLNLFITDSCLPNDIRKKRVYKYISKNFNF